VGVSLVGYLGMKAKGKIAHFRTRGKRRTDLWNRSRSEIAKDPPAKWAPGKGAGVSSKERENSENAANKPHAITGTVCSEPIEQGLSGVSEKQGGKEFETTQKKKKKILLVPQKKGK